MADISRTCGLPVVNESMTNVSGFTLDDITGNIKADWTTGDDGVVAIFAVEVADDARIYYGLIDCDDGTVSMPMTNTGEHRVFWRREYLGEASPFSMQEFMYLDGETGLDFLDKEDDDLLLTEASKKITLEA